MSRIYTPSGPDILKGRRFTLNFQVFESHDSTGTDIDTVSSKGDYILFSHNGKAYMNYKNRLDSLSYTTHNDSVSFGDTPFKVTKIRPGVIELYQNEENAHGDYNRVTYFLSDDNMQDRYK